jgi:hypothetical protein
MLELLAAPALAAGIVSILAWNVRAGLVTPTVEGFAGSCPPP